VRLGVHVTVQPPLLYALAAPLLHHWGPERARHVMPVRAWLDAGAELSGGTDYPVASFDPLESVWGFVTRETERDGVLGAEYAIDAYEAFALYTTGGARLDGDGARRGVLAPGRLADLVAFPADPITAPTERLRALRPVFTVVGGRVVHSTHPTLEGPR
jgi:predicted amidohydrolase YtcJ